MHRCLTLDIYRRCCSDCRARVFEHLASCFPWFCARSFRQSCWHDLFPPFPLGGFLTTTILSCLCTPSVYQRGTTLWIILSHLRSPGALDAPPPLLDHGLSPSECIAWSSPALFQPLTLHVHCHSPPSLSLLLFISSCFIFILSSSSSLSSAFPHVPFALVSRPLSAVTCPGKILSRSLVHTHRTLVRLYFHHFHLADPP